jgi:hypothetical protein
VEDRRVEGPLEEERNISRDVNITKLNTDQMLRVKKSLGDLFQKENNRSLNQKNDLDDILRSTGSEK